MLPIRRAARGHGRRFIAITGGKGGVGRSTIASNLAIAYANAGARTALVDGDSGMADLNLILGVAPERSLLDLLEGRPLDEVVVETHGITLLPGLAGSSRLASPTSCDRSRIREAIDDVRNRYETVLFDAPAGLEPCALTVTAMADVVTVVTPEPLALAGAYGSLKALSSMHGLRRAFLLPNQTASDDEGRALAKDLGAVVDRFLGIDLILLPAIPNDPTSADTVIHGVPAMVARPCGPMSQAIHRAAQALDGHLGERRCSNEGGTR